MSCGWRWVLVSSLRTRIETTKSPVEASRVTTTKKKIQGHPHKCRKGYADVLLWPRRPSSDRLPAMQESLWNHPPYSPDLSPCNYAISGLLKRLWGSNDSPWTTMSCSTCGTGSQRSPGNLMRQPFTALCRSGTRASTARANTSDIQVLVSVPRPSARFLTILLQMKNTVFLFKSCTIIYLSFHLYVLRRSPADPTMTIVCLR